MGPAMSPQEGEQVVGCQGAGVICRRDNLTGISGKFFYMTHEQWPRGQCPQRPQCCL